MMSFAVLLFALAASSHFTHTCPGGKSICPDTATCCLIDVGIYGCCPMKDAVCCDDRIHCCPFATKCDTEHKQCLRNGILRENRIDYFANPVRIAKRKQFFRICSPGNSL